MSSLSPGIGPTLTRGAAPLDDLATPTLPDGTGTGSDDDFARWLFAQECRFVAGIASLDALPEGGLPEIAFAGRSNVGKSSLVNMLTGRRTLARTSHTPGRTQQLNFFDLAGRLTLVDLPGYGYARAPKGEVARWTRLIEMYLKGRVPLRRVCVMIDARHGLKNTDRPVLDMLDRAAVSYQLVLTKADKLGAAALEARIEELRVDSVKRTAAFPEIFVTSAHDGIGVEPLRASLAAFAAGDRPSAPA